MISVWTLAFIGLVLLIIIAVIGGNLASKKAAKKAVALFSEIDHKYESFIQNRVTYSVLKKDNLELDKDEIIKEALVIFKPELQSILSHINSTNYSSVKIEYQSKYFNNLVTITESLYSIKSKNPAKRLSEKDEEEFYESFSDALNADITRRAFELQTGIDMN